MCGSCGFSAGGHRHDVLGGVGWQRRRIVVPLAVLVVGSPRTGSRWRRLLTAARRYGGAAALPGHGARPRVQRPLRDPLDAILDWLDKDSTF